MDLAVELIPSGIIRRSRIKDGEPDLEYAGIERWKYNVRLSTHAVEIHRLVQEIVDSDAQFSNGPDPRWYKPVSAEDELAWERSMDLASPLRLVTKYLGQEAARRVRAGETDAATDSLLLLVRLTQKASAEPVELLRVNLMAWFLAGDDYAPVLDRLTQAQRGRLHDAITRFDEQDPRGTRGLAFENAKLSIAAMEEALIESDGVHSIASRYRAMFSDPTSEGREPGSTIFEKSIYLLFTDIVWADALERSEPDQVERRVERAKQLVTMLERAESDADLEPILDEMIADETNVLRIILGGLPATIRGSWRLRDGYRELRSRLAS